MFNFKPIYFVIFAIILFKSYAKISDKRLCIDVNCSEIISVGKTTLRYSSIEDHVLSFAPNEDVKVYSHGAGNRPELVGVEINGQRGYINKNHFRETKLIKRPKLLIDTELLQNDVKEPLEHLATEIKADPTLQPYEVIDGTRLPLDLASLSTESPIVNIGTEQTSGDTTKPLDSVHESQNDNSPAAKEPIVDDYGNKNNVGQQQQEQQQQNLDVKEDEDIDDEDEESDDINGEDDEDDEDEENETVDTDQEETVKDSTKNIDANILLNENVGSEVDAVEAADKDSTVNVPENVLASELPGVLSNTAAENLLKSKEVPLEVENENSIVNEQVSKESSQNNDQTQINPENDNKDSEQPKVETIGVQEDIENNSVERSIPLEHIFSAIPNIEVEDSIEADSSQAKNEKLVTNDSPSDGLVSIQDQIKDPSHSLPVPSTEIPLDITETLNIDAISSDPISQIVQSVSEHGKNDTQNGAVTPDPVSSLEINSIHEDSKNASVNGESNPSSSESSEFGLEFKSSEDRTEIKDEEKPGASWFGLGSILPTYITGENHDVGDESDASANKDSRISEENLQNEAPVVNKSTDDNAQHNQAVSTNENLVSTEQNSIPQSSNPEASIQNSLEYAESQNKEKVSDNGEETPGEFIENGMSYFTEKDEENKVNVDENSPPSSSDSLEVEAQELNENKGEGTNHWPSNNIPEESIEISNESCNKEDQNCLKYQMEVDRTPEERITRSISMGAEDLQILIVEAFSSDLFLYLTTTAISVIFLVFGMVILDKCRREGPLIARINKLEKQLLTTMKENEVLQEKSAAFVEENTQLVVDTVPNEVVEELNQKLAEMNLQKLSLEEQIQALEKELDTSTEVGIELNKIISEMLNSSDGSEIIKENIEQMQKKLLDQQDTINTINETLNLKETENHELRLEMEISNRKVIDLQSELDRMVEKILKIEEERDQQHSTLENEIVVYKTKYKETLSKEQTLDSEIQVLKQQLTKSQRVAELKVKEYNTLKESLNEIKSVKNNKEALKSLLEVTEIKAQVEQLKMENSKYLEQLSQEREANVAYGAKIESLMQEVSSLREKYEQADKEKVEINTKLQVLNIYFKEREEQMQKEISKYESLWAVKEGEATSTTERIRHMQEELQNYRAQNESLKQEIVNQEVELKSQISMLEKKAHESWVANRQTERKLEETRQEAAQLRNRLTLRERALAEGHSAARMQFPLHQNGELPLSPPPIDPTQSPPPLYNPRDHLAKSPPIPGMPPPFLPPPLGATPFIPPPPLDGMMPPPLGEMGGMPPPFMPPLPPGMFPGDHRPPPLGRMSSPPPVGGRYTPESTVYSDYDRYSRRSPSPPYDSEYGASPPPIRGYSPYQDRLRDDRREYKRPQARSNGRNSKGIHSSGSENDSLGKINKKPQRKV